MTDFLVVVQAKRCREAATDPDEAEAEADESVVGGSGQRRAWRGPGRGFCFWQFLSMTSSGAQVFSLIIRSAIMDASTKKGESVGRLLGGLEGY